MATADLTPTQLDAIALGARSIPQPSKAAADATSARVTFYKSDIGGAFAGHIVAEVDLGDGGAPTTIDTTDTTVILAAERTALVQVLKRCVAEARTRKGAV